MIDVNELWDPNKKGTIIISCYRSGTHFVLDNLNVALLTRLTLNLGEVDDYSFLTRNTDRYILAILNSVKPKVHLVGNQHKLSQWHKVQLTRNDKIGHRISDYLWKYHNTLEQRFNATNLPHHGGTPENYKHIKAVDFDLDVLGSWLLEQHIVNLFHADVSIDYDDLKSITGTSITWNPNVYGLTLEDLFINHKEIKEFLTQDVPNVNKK